MLTEAYGLHFEGKPAAIAAEGRILQMAEPQGEPARTGAIVAILTGSKAGTWHRVAQAIDAKTLLVDPPLPADADAVSVSNGFVFTTFRGNTIDARGASVATGMVLVGNQFTVKVQDNHIIGIGDAFKIASCPAEKPVHWGWSHDPALGLLIEGNTIEDSLRGGLLSVEHGPPIKTSRGRVYLRGVFRNNTVIRSDAFEKQAGAKLNKAGFTIGDPGALDPGELIVTEEANTAHGPAGATLRIHAGTINGHAVKGQNKALPAAPTTAQERKTTTR